VDIQLTTRNKVLLEKVLATQLANKFAATSATRRLINVFKRALHNEPGYSRPDA
jgi:hypothetical protein